MDWPLARLGEASFLGDDLHGQCGIQAQRAHSPALARRGAANGDGEAGLEGVLVGPGERRGLSYGGRRPTLRVRRPDPPPIEQPIPEVDGQDPARRPVPTRFIADARSAWSTPASAPVGARVARVAAPQGGFGHLQGVAEVEQDRPWPLPRSKKPRPCPTCV